MEYNSQRFGGLYMPAPVSPITMMDSRGTRFLVTAEYPPEKQKFMADKLKESMVANGMEPREPTGMMGFSFTLDEALDYFKRLKEIQDYIEAEERKEQQGSGPGLA
jgi:hypothetical protein